MRKPLICLIAVFASACGTTPAPPDDAPAGGGGQDAFRGQRLTWKPCPASDIPSPTPGTTAPPLQFECTTIKVPLDYSKPGGKTIALALNRIPATDRGNKIGSLLTNPGGPGESGLQLVYANAKREIFTPRLRERYDIIGMDPRGIGKSHPVRCQSAEEMTKTQTTQPDELKQVRAFVAACRAKSGADLPFMGTDNVARDLDVVRSVLGDEKLNYLGFSYGTVLGQFYADQFPDNTGRMVLDSIANPSSWPGDASAQAMAFDNAMQVFVDTCVARDDCPMGDNRGAVLKKIDDLADKLETKPLSGGENGPPISTGLLLQTLSNAMYIEEDWPQLESMLAAAFHGNGEPIARHIAAQQSTAGSAAASDATGGNQAVYCMHLRPEQRSLKAVKESGEESMEDAPLFGGMSASEFLTCSQWPAKSLPNAGRAIAAEGAPPILLVHNIHDAATPIEWGRGVAGQLDKSVLVTNSGGGHGFYTKGPCTKKTVDDFLITGQLPAEGTTCHDRNPVKTTTPQPS